MAITKWFNLWRRPIDIIIALLTFSVVIGCATVPQVRVWRPWQRTLENGEQIKVGASIKIEVFGQATPLLGIGKLADKKIQNLLQDLLERRGFIITDDSPDYRMEFLYATLNEDRAEVSSSVSSSNINQMLVGTASGSGAGVGGGRALGVSIAKAIAAISNEASSTSTLRISNDVAYRHTISCEIFDKTDALLWKGESTWSSADIDIARELLTALKLIVSDLPYNPAILPSVPSIKSSRAEDFYMQAMRGYEFSCPALPYRIKFGDLRFIVRNRQSKADKEMEMTQSGKAIDKNALAAFVDLIETAQYAIPEGDADWSRPVRGILWKKVMLGGKYRLGIQGEPCSILIKLTGNTAGYTVQKCWVASDTEYAAFEAKLAKWRQALRDYYDVYER